MTPEQLERLAQLEHEYGLHAEDTPWKNRVGRELDEARRELNAEAILAAFREMQQERDRMKQERDWQYDQNAEQIVRIAELEAVVTPLVWVALKVGEISEDRAAQVLGMTIRQMREARAAAKEVPHVE